MKNIKNISLNILNGIIIGGANVIPGVSGGTLAFILGIYEQLTESIGEFFQNKSKRKEYIKFLVQISIGGVIGIFLFAKVIGFLYSNYSEFTNFFFVGLIMSSIPFIIKSNKNMEITKGKFLSFLIGFSIIILISYSKSDNTDMIHAKNPDFIIDNLYLLKLFFCGWIAAGAMVIPGISGSLLLILLGEYQNIIYFVNSRKFIPIIFIAIGAIFGVLFLAKIIDKLLKNHHSLTLYFIIGLIIASIGEIWPKNINWGINIFFDIILVLVGFGVAYLLENLN
ncbi:MAG: DUF368 domain-containing protein [Fusobacteriota bacterium]